MLVAATVRATWSAVNGLKELRFLSPSDNLGGSSAEAMMSLFSQFFRVGFVGWQRNSLRWITFVVFLPQDR